MRLMKFTTSFCAKLWKIHLDVAQIDSSPQRGNGIERKSHTKVRNMTTRQRTDNVLEKPPCWNSMLTQQREALKTTIANDICCGEILCRLLFLGHVAPRCRNCDRQHQRLELRQQMRLPRVDTGLETCSLLQAYQGHIK